MILGRDEISTGCQPPEIAEEAAATALAILRALFLTAENYSVPS